MTEQQAKEVIGRIDQVLSQVTLDRKSHAQLAKDVQAIQEQLKLSYMKKEKKSQKKTTPQRPGTEG